MPKEKKTRNRIGSAIRRPTHLSTVTLLSAVSTPSSSGRRAGSHVTTSTGVMTGLVLPPQSMAEGSLAGISIL